MSREWKKTVVMSDLVLLRCGRFCRLRIDFAGIRNFVLQDFSRFAQENPLFVCEVSDNR